MTISNTMKIKQQDGSFKEVKISYIEPDYCTAEGVETTASQHAAHAEGVSTTASGVAAHAEGGGTTASKHASHAEGEDTTADGEAAHAEGSGTTASGDYSHAEGGDTIAEKAYAHAEGFWTRAQGVASHAGGYSTTAWKDNQTVIGQYGPWNAEDVPNVDNILFAVANGTAPSNRSLGHILDKDGNAWFAGDIRLGEDDISINLFNNLIWENTSPNSPGPENGWVITSNEEEVGMYYSEAMKNLNKYSFIYIIFKTVYSGDYIIDTKIPVPQNTGQNYSRQVFSLSNAASSNTIEILTRSVVVSQPEKQTFYIEIPSGKVKKITATTEATINNNILIPVAIYGIL